VCELAPLAVLGPAGVKAAAQTLQRCGGWLKLASRLGSKRCTQSASCELTGMYFDRAKVRRLCCQHKTKAARLVPLLLNDFMYDTHVSYEVHTAAELEAAVGATRPGQCIRVNGHITLDTDRVLHIYNRRLIGPAREPGQAPLASITLVRTPLVVAAVIIKDLRVVSGDNGEYDMYFWDAEPEFFPGIQACEDDALLMYNCHVVARQVCVHNFCFVSVKVCIASFKVLRGSLLMRRSTHTVCFEALLHSARTNLNFVWCTTCKIYRARH
jgi:hypothetical protein